MLRPLGDRVIVRRIEEKKDPSKLIEIPDNVKEKPLEGEVTAVGRGRLVNGVTHPLEVKKGDRVLFGRYAGAEAKIKNEDLLILREEEILAVL